jgi:hypothetical protein
LKKRDNSSRKGTIEENENLITKIDITKIRIIHNTIRDKEVDHLNKKKAGIVFKPANADSSNK